jgi:GT2 family glycosyltransferase
MRPLLSVLMASYDAAATIGLALESLVRQSRADSIEIVVVDSTRDDTAADVAERFPAVRLLRSRERLFAGAARNRGAAVANGDILAFVDADCTVAEDWAQRVLDAHAADRPLIGGVVLNGNPESRAGWAYYFAEFHQWLPGSPAGAVAEVPGCSMTVRRSAYDRFGPFLEGAYCSDTQFNWRLAAAGAPAWLDPTIRVAHLNPGAWSKTLRHELRHGADFARLRSRERLGRGGAAARALAAPLLPGLLFARVARDALRRPEHRRPFLRAAPRLLTLLAAWSAGEARGYLESAGRRAAATA